MVYIVSGYPYPRVVPFGRSLSSTAAMVSASELVSVTGSENRSLH